jgi:hypothetical protein
MNYKTVHLLDSCVYLKNQKMHGTQGYKVIP